LKAVRSPPQAIHPICTPQILNVPFQARSKSRFPGREVRLSRGHHFERNAWTTRHGGRYLETSMRLFGRYHSRDIPSMKNAPACHKTKFLFLKFGLKRSGLTAGLSCGAVMARRLFLQRNSKSKSLHSGRPVAPSAGAGVRCVLYFLVLISRCLPYKTVLRLDDETLVA
jgi:hypothetical protein